jgi:hypothetical protein
VEIGSPADRSQPNRRRRALAAALLLACASAACRPDVPVVDAHRAAGAHGTISGTVRGPEGASPEGRSVEVVSVETGERQVAVTTRTGGFTFKVRPGRYRVELALRPGETVIKQPGLMDVTRGVGDAQGDFVLGNVRISRPRPAYRLDNGLGSPIA